MVQDIGVAVIVIAAVAFLFRHFFGRRKPKKATTFVPLSKLKQKPRADHCH